MSFLFRSDLIANSANNVVGGSNASAGNLISGNDQNGVPISGAASTENRVRGNLIGTDIDGLNPLASYHHGKVISATALYGLVGMPLGPGVPKARMRTVEPEEKPPNW